MTTAEQILQTLTKATRSDCMCGCGRHPIDLSSNETVHYKGDWWLLRCLCMKLDRRIPTLIARFDEMKREVDAAKKMRLKFTRMKKFMRQQPCYMCGKTVGNRWVHYQDSIMCGGCNKEMMKEL